MERYLVVLSFPRYLLPQGAVCWQCDLAITRIRQDILENLAIAINEISAIHRAANSPPVSKLTGGHVYDLTSLSRLGLAAAWFCAG